jgi:nicotinamidase-related amidase
MKSTSPALIVIDMENGFLNESSAQCIPGALTTVTPCAQVIAACRQQGIPVFFVNRVYRADGSDVEYTRYHSWEKGGRAMSPGCPEEISSAMPEVFAVSPQDYCIVKPRFSAFFQTELDLILRRLRVDTIILMGTTTPNCIRTTCYDGISLEYNVVVLRDCTSSATQEIQESNLRDMQNIGAKIMSSEAFIYGTATVENLTSQVQDAVAEHRR